MRPFPKVEQTYLSTFVKNLLSISGEKKSDFLIIEHSRNRQGDSFDPKIKGIMRSINKVYSLFREHLTLSNFSVRDIDSLAGFISTAYLNKDKEKFEADLIKPANQRTLNELVPTGCLSTGPVPAFLDEWLVKLKKLDENGDEEEKAAFAWFTPYRFVFSAPYQIRNFELGLIIFLYLRMHWEMPFFMYGLTRGEVWLNLNEYSKFWIKNGLWSDPDFPPLHKDKQDSLVGTE